MKVFIWTIVLLIVSLIALVINDTFTLGGIPSAIIFTGLDGAAIKLSIELCKKWDKHKANKVNAGNLSNTQRLSPKYLGKGYICPICKLTMDVLIPCEKCGYIPPNKHTTA